VLGNSPEDLYQKNLSNFYGTSQEPGQSQDPALIENTNKFYMGDDGKKNKVK